jgi:hypothetical protein
MTKEQFLGGTSFKVISNVNYKGASTFRYDGECLMKETRSSIDEQVIYFAYHLNIKKIGRVGFEGFTYVMNKRVTIKHKFTDLEPFILETSVGE